MTTRHAISGLWAILLFTALVSSGCASANEQASPYSYPTAPAPRAEVPFPNWPMSPDRAEQILPAGDAEVIAAKGAGAGTTGALRVTLHFQGAHHEKAFKWKEVPRRRMDGINNAPRKEIAAYELQKLFLDPEDYVVPTTRARCVDIETYPFRGRASLSGTRCVFGVLTVWLRDVTVPDELYEEERFREDSTYAYFMANVNLFTYLMDHQDGRSGNFLVSTDGRRQVYSIDNGVAMNRWPFYNWFVPNWDEIRVPALRRESVERLRALERSDLDRLAVLQEFTLDDQGLYHPVEPGPPITPDRGVRVHADSVQFGLTTSEIDGVWRRIEKLLAKVDRGKVALF